MIMKEGVENFDALPFRRGLHHLVDPLRPQADLLVPRHQVLLRTRHLLRRGGFRARDGRPVRQARGAHHAESHLSNTSTKFYGEITQQMLKYQNGPGSNNGTGLFQTLCASRCASSTSALLRLRSSSRRKFTALATVLRVGVARGRYAGRIEGSKS